MLCTALCNEGAKFSLLWPQGTYLDGEIDKQQNKYTLHECNNRRWVTGWSSLVAQWERTRL